MDQIERRARELLAAEYKRRGIVNLNTIYTEAAYAAISAALRSTARDEALEEAAKVADQWAEQNKAGALKAHRRARKAAYLGFDTVDMGGELDACANECSAIALAIRALKEA